MAATLIPAPVMRAGAALAPQRPRVRVKHDVEPAAPAEHIDTVEAELADVRVRLERLVHPGTPTPPVFFLGVYLDRSGGDAREFGELGDLTLADLLTLHATLGRVISTARRRGLLMSADAGEG